MKAPSLLEILDHQPEPLQFGTSGRRGLVKQLTQLEVYINARADLEFLLSLPREEGGIRREDEFYIAFDLRPSSTSYVPGEGGRGEMVQAIEQAVRDAGLAPVILGPLPTPALTAYAMERERGSMMVTGSHIPFDRNGYKTNSARGELKKQDERPVLEQVSRIRSVLYAQAAGESMFDKQGRFKGGTRPIGKEREDGRESYLARYLDFFPGSPCRGLRVVVYQHSAVGRDLLAEMLRRMGADVLEMGRSDTFVPIDTENIDAERLAAIDQLAKEAWREWGPLHAVVSTDGDSDRPLILGVSAASGDREGDRRCGVRFYPGDLVGMVVAESLDADAIVVPISCNDGIDLGPLRKRVEPKTRIGSPFVIAGMEAAKSKGKQRICGWEANGGFLTGSDIARGGEVLRALPTRDAFLPIATVLAALQGGAVNMAHLFDRLPRRYGRAALLKAFPRKKGLEIIRALGVPLAGLVELEWKGDWLVARDGSGNALEVDAAAARCAADLRARIEHFFGAANGFSSLARANYVDGVRLSFINGDVAHVRPSGNADELRIYVVADSQERADQIARLGVMEPDGILRKLEREMA